MRAARSASGDEGEAEEAATAVSADMGTLGESSLTIVTPGLAWPEVNSAYPKPIEIGAMASNYESEITQFLKDFKKTHPDVEQRQREGRALLWDKNQDTELLEGFRAGRVPQRPYVYSAD